MVKGMGRLMPLKVFMAFCAVLLCGTVALAQGGGRPALSVDDCLKCHEKQPMEIEANGAAHKTKINCRDCHQGHRPAVANNIPQCSMCHSGQKHFELKDCTSCHNPHQPLAIVLKGELKAPCLTCHTGPQQQMDASPSKHGGLACNFCHAEKHGVIPECLQCHEPHSDKMTQADCKTCHQAHQPLTLTYGPQTASVLCAACHQTAFNQLAATATKHHDVACVTCHQNKHKTVPKCSDCHGLPHAETIHQKFPKCGECHNTAHDLNNFTSVSKKKEAPKKEEPARKEVKGKDSKGAKDAKKGK